MAKYASQSSLALRMLKAKGTLTTFTRPGAVTDPVTQESVDTSTTYQAYLMALPLSAGKARHLFGEAADITKPRLSLTIALKDVGSEPRNGDRFAWGSKNYAILSVEPLDPAGEGAILAQGYAEAA